MKSKVFLPLIEQTCMILLFALVAALCLQGFSVAKNISADHVRCDMAVETCRNAAEMIKLCDGDLEAASDELGGEVTDGTWRIRYDNEWSPSPDGEILLTADHTESSHPLLGCTVVSVERDGEEIFSLEVGWQREASE